MEERTNILPEMTVEEKLKRVEEYIFSLREDSHHPLDEKRIHDLQFLVRDEVNVIDLIENIPLLREVWKTDYRKLNPLEREQTILGLMRFDPRIRRIDMARMMNVQFTTVKNHIRKLEETKVVYYEGPSKTGHWRFYKMTII